MLAFFAGSYVKFDFSEAKKGKEKQILHRKSKAKPTNSSEFILS
jgi:hypothetical protein